MTDRREFLAAAGAGLVAAHTEPASAIPRQSNGLTILFQGDSVTDCGRDRGNLLPNHAAALGNGYPLLVAANLLRIHPDKGLRFFNRGISGHKVPDLAARWDGDAINLRPDVLSILIGVNDFWHRLLTGYNGTVRDYADGYAALIERTKAALPQTRIVVLEPFALRSQVVTDAWFPEFDDRRAAAARVAEQAGVQFVPLNATFQRLAARGGAAWWAGDGVHPTPAGHSVIAQAWMQAIRF